jgi:hypothetical protein
LLLLEQVQFADLVGEIIALLLLKSAKLSKSLLIGRFLDSELLVLEVHFLTVKLLEQGESLFIFLLLELLFKLQLFVSHLKGLLFLPDFILKRANNFLLAVQLTANLLLIVDFLHLDVIS